MKHQKVPVARTLQEMVMCGFEWYFWGRAAAWWTVLLLSMCFLGGMHKKAFSWALHFHGWPQGHGQKTSKLWWSGRRWEIQVTSNSAEMFSFWCFAILNRIITLPEEVFQTELFWDYFSPLAFMLWFPCIFFFSPKSHWKCLKLSPTTSDVSRSLQA